MKKVSPLAMMLSLQSPGEPGTELDTPEPNGFVGDCDASLSKQIFDITVAEVESEVKPDCIADDSQVGTGNVCRYSFRNYPFSRVKLSVRLAEMMLENRLPS